MTSETDLNSALDEIARLRSAIRTHRDAMQGQRDYAALTAIDIELWLVLREPTPSKEQ